MGMTKTTKLLSIPITEDIEGFPVPMLSFAIATHLWMSKNPKKEIEKMFKLNKSQNHNFGN
jgi:hypothetical protein